MSIFRNMKLVQKISLLSISFLAFLVIIGFTSIRQISNVNSKLMELNDSRMAPIIELENMKSDVEYIRSQGNEFMDASDDSSKNTIKTDIEARITSLTAKLSKYKDSSDFKDLFNNYDSFITFKDAFIKSQADRGTPGQGGVQGQPQDNSMTVGPPADVANFDKGKTALVSSFDEIINNHIAEAKNTYSDSKIVYRNTVVILTALVITCIIITLILSIIIIRAITRPLKKVTTKLKEISQSNGDLTQRIEHDSKDEIGQLSGSFDEFMSKLQLIISEVAVSAETISSSSKQLNEAAVVTTKSLEEITSTVVEIAAGTSDGAAVAEETTASLSEAARFSEATASASKNTTTNSKKAKEAAEEGAAKISEIVTTITDIENSSKEVSVMIDELEESSKKIGEIIKIITSISVQTNLLALNAAIEAARAGEAGRGFNVVADEIRKLADESNNAAREISELVKENQLKSAFAVNSVALVEKKVAIGVTRASEVGESINNIIENIQLIVSEIEQIDYANEKQAESTKEIEKVISSIAVSSNEIAAGTENISESIEQQLTIMTEMEKTTERLSEMANKLSEITAGFTV